MKKTLLLISFSVLALFGWDGRTMAQCPGCVISVSCTSSPAAPTICPDTLPDGVAMQPYSQDISFYLPNNFNDAGTGYNVDLDQLDVLSIVGMPYGLTWQTSASPSNIYYPNSNPPASEHGCARICGTPLVPGNYIITVFVLAHVTVNSLGGISTTSNSSFDLPLTILPAASSNGGFTITNPVGCAPLTTGFTNNRPSNGNAGFSYAWSFGNGNQSSLENPPGQTYNTPGDYPITLQTTIDTLGYYLQSVTVNASPDCNDSPWSDPDYFFKLKQGSTTIYTAPYIDNDAAPVTFSFSPITLNNATYSLEVWDYDDGLAGSDDHCGTVTFNGHNAGTFTLQNGTMVVSYTINHPVLTLTDRDTIHVYQPPVVSSVSVAPNDTVCQGDSVLLWVSSVNGGIYQWYADTNAILNAVDSFYYAVASGTYYVEVSNTQGCRSISAPKKVTIIPNPPKPGIWIIENTLNTNLTGYDLQWYYEQGLISGANAMTYDITQSGNYYLMATNWFGCATSSDTVYFTCSIGMDEYGRNGDIQILPNPNSGRFTVKINLPNAGEVQLLFRDLTGRTLREYFLSPIAGTVEQEIDLGRLPSGMYLMEVMSQGRRTVEKVMIK